MSWGTILGTEMTLVTFILTIIAFVVLFFQSINFLSRQQDQSRLRFLILTSFYIIYNLCSGLLPDENLKINLLIQNIFAYGSGIALASYFYYYLVKEFNITQGKMFNIRALVISLISTFLLIFVIGTMATGDMNLSKQLYIIFPIAIAVYFCVKTVQFLIGERKNQVKDNSPNKLMVTSGYIGIIFMATMPVIVFFGDYQSLNIGLVNISFFVVCYAYIKRHIYQSNLEYEMISNIRHQTTNKLEGFPYYLTPKELEISYLILLDLKYAEIADVLYIAEKTVSKHASNIFKKANCKNKMEYINRFSQEIRKINNVIAEISLENNALL